MVKKKSIFPLTKLSDVISMKSGESITAERITSEGKFPCFGGNGLRGYTTTFTHDGSYTLVGRQGALCGNVTFVSGRFYASEHAIVVTPKKETDIKFMSYVLYDMNLNQYSESSAQPGLSVKKLLELEYPIPQNKEEQTAIAEALSDIDSLISSLQKLIEKKKAIKQGAMQELLTGKKRLPGFSGEWKKYKVGEIGVVVTGSTPPRSNRNLWGGNFPWVSARDFIGKYISSSYEHVTSEGKNYCRILPAESVLVTCIASIGLNGIAAIPLATNQQINAIVCNNDFYNEIVYYSLVYNKEKLKLMAGQTAVPIISKQQFEEFEILLPRNVLEQKAIAKVLSDMDCEIEQLEKKLAKYQQIKQGMMQELLTGRIRLKEGENNA